MSGSGTVLVTGAAGFIGSHLVERLARDGHRVRAFIRYNGRDDRGCLELLEPDLLAKIDVFRGDLKDPDAVRRAVKGCVRVFHLGALIAIPYSYGNPLDVIQTNVEGTAHLLNACRDSDSLERVVLTSTSEVYGTAQRVPIDETHPLVGQSPYAASKIGSDALGIAYHRSFGLPVTILRPFNTFGPRQSTRAIVPTIMSQALAGSTLKLGSLDPRRDLTEVSDTVAGFVGISECDEALGRVVNIGRGSDVSIGELVELAGNVLGRPLSVETDPQRIRPANSEVGRLLADAGLAHQLFGWKPRVSLEEGLRRVADHLRNHPTRRVGQYAT